MSLPPYAYVPGQQPHPRRDPRGHGFRPPTSHGDADLAAWRDSACFLAGVDLFNEGYYWEAHEAWEALWLAAGRQGPAVALLRGLIVLAASGVKWRQGRQAAASRMAHRAARIFEAAEAATGARCVAGLEFAELCSAARLAASSALPTAAGVAVAVVFPFRLDPRA
jgi:predicted metal-dependent hydrolase